jgi:hypothetical protein
MFFVDNKMLCLKNKKQTSKFCFPSRLFFSRNPLPVLVSNESQILETWLDKQKNRTIFIYF